MKQSKTKDVGPQVPNAAQTAQTRDRYNRIAPLYDLLEILPERRFVSWRKMLWEAMPAGEILEVGIGTGKNIPYHPAETTITAIDLSEGMLARAQRKAKQLGKTLTMQQMDVQQLQFADNTFDAAVATFVFCSVPDPILGLRELSRVVKPNGQITLLDHVRIDQPVIGTLMDLMNPLFVRFYGANINRRTVENVRQAGLIIDSVTDLGPMGMIKFTIGRPGK